MISPEGRFQKNNELRSTLSKGKGKEKIQERNHQIDSLVSYRNQTNDSNSTYTCRISLNSDEICTMSDEIISEDPKMKFKKDLKSQSLEENESDQMISAYSEVPKVKSMNDFNLLHVKKSLDVPKNAKEPNKNSEHEKENDSKEIVKEKGIGCVKELINKFNFQNKDQNNLTENMEEMKTDEHCIQLVYSYTSEDSKNINSHNELITFQIEKKEDSYILKKEITSIPFDRYGHFFCLTKDNTLIAIGGTDGKKKYKIVEAFCEETKTWKQLNVMHFARSNFCGLCTEDNGLLILGGEGDQSILKSVEFFERKINTWRSLPPLTEVRHSASAVIHQNCVYVIGGRDGIGNYGKLHKSVEMLNLNEKNLKWIMCSSMKQARLGLATIVFKNKLYAIGGTTGIKFLNSVEIYDFHKNVWKEGPSLNYARTNLVVFIWKNSLVVYGGINEQDGGFVKYAEILDEKTLSWVVLKE